MIPKECKRLAEVVSGGEGDPPHRAGEVYPARAPLDAASAVGQAAAGGLPSDADGAAAPRPLRRELPCRVQRGAPTAAMKNRMDTAAPFATL